MSKNNKGQRTGNTERQNAAPVDGFKASASDNVVRVRSFVPLPCSSCQRLRDMDEKIKGESCSFVMSTQGRTRYCKCRFCGQTWKETGE